MCIKIPLPACLALGCQLARIHTRTFKIIVRGRMFSLSQLVVNIPP